MKRFARIAALACLLTVGSAFVNAPEAQSGRSWYWVLFISFCYTPCDPVLDPGGNDYCNCYR